MQSERRVQEILITTLAIVADGSDAMCSKVRVSLLHLVDQSTEPEVSFLDINIL